MAFTIYAPRAKNPAPIKGILFDMDGIVLDTERLYSRFWMEAAVSLGYPMTYQQALGMRALDTAAGTAKLQSYFGPDVSYSAVRAARIQRMDAYVNTHGVQPKPGVRALLAYLKDRGIPKALATSSPIERVRQYLGPLELLDGFDILCTRYEVPRGKPEPDIFLYAAEKLGLPPACCMVLEDSPAGILAAHRAGCFAVMIPDQDPPNSEILPLLYGKADSLLDIIDLLEENRITP